MTVTTHGKQVLLNGAHFADASDIAAAEKIAAAFAELAAIVAFLRTRDHVCADILADQIEAGKYREAASE